MQIAKLLAHSSTATALILLMTVRPAFASHMSGGENDLMGLYGGASLVIGFVGLLGMLGLVPRNWAAGGYRWGKWLLVVALSVLVGGGFHVTTLAGAEKAAGSDAAWGRMATQQLIGTLAVFGTFSGAAYYLAKRTGVLDMGEQVKYSVLRNGDPADRTASRVARPGEQRLMAIPLIAMGAIALFLTAGVLIVLSRLPASARP